MKSIIKLMSVICFTFVALWISPTLKVPPSTKSAHAESSIIQKTTTSPTETQKPATESLEQPIKEEVAPAPTPPPPAPAPAPVVTAANGDCEAAMVAAEVTDLVNARELIRRENASCNPCKRNGGIVDCNYEGSKAYGIPQSLPGSKMAAAGADWRTNPVTQIKWMQSYVLGRYKSWANAVAFHNANNWY